MLQHNVDADNRRDCLDRRSPGGALSLGHCASIDVVMVICPVPPMTIITLLTSRHVSTANLYKRVRADSWLWPTRIMRPHHGRRDLSRLDARKIIACYASTRVAAVTQLYCL